MLTGRISILHACGKTGIIETNVWSGGSWIGKLRYGFAVEHSVNLGDEVGFISSWSEKGAWALDVRIRPQENPGGVVEQPVDLDEAHDTDKDAIAVSAKKKVLNVRNLSGQAPVSWDSTTEQRAVEIPQNVEHRLLSDVDPYPPPPRHPSARCAQKRASFSQKQKHKTRFMYEPICALDNASNACVEDAQNVVGLQTSIPEHSLELDNVSLKQLSDRCLTPCVLDGQTRDEANCESLDISKSPLVKSYDQGKASYLLHRAYGKWSNCVTYLEKSTYIHDLRNKLADALEVEDQKALRSVLRFVVAALAPPKTWKHEQASSIDEYTSGIHCTHTRMQSILRNMALQCLAHLDLEDTRSAPALMRIQTLIHAYEIEHGDIDRVASKANEWSKLKSAIWNAGMLGNQQTHLGTRKQTREVNASSGNSTADKRCRSLHEKIEFEICKHVVDRRNSDEVERIEARKAYARTEAHLSRESACGEDAMPVSHVAPLDSTKDAKHHDDSHVTGTISRCPHGRLKHHCTQCIGCPHGKLPNHCRLCMACRHGMVKYNCARCNGCPHGRLKQNCAKCSGCPHGKVRSYCVKCRGCPHGLVRSYCAKCSGCPHGKVKQNCATCSGCPHGKIKSNCRLCKGCPHGKVKAKCALCTGCCHGKVKQSCVQCSGCPHGKLKKNCRQCYGCPHGRVRQHCVMCCGCPHGRVKNQCAKCKGCPHGKLKHFCASCSGCSHGKVKFSCVECNGCPHGRLTRNCAQCTGCPHGKVRGKCSECIGAKMATLTMKRLG